MVYSLKKHYFSLKDVYWYFSRKYLKVRIEFSQGEGTPVFYLPATFTNVWDV